MNTSSRIAGLASVLVAVLLAGGCATSSSETKSEPKAETKAKPEKEAKAAKPAPVANPSKVKLGEFKQVEVKCVTLAEKHAKNKANQESAAKMDTMLQNQLRTLFPTLKVIPKGEDFPKASERTLQITPLIKDIRLISTGSRVWLGPMAGGSHLYTQVTFRDSSTGEVVADPEFYQDSGAWEGGWSMGAADNRLRDETVSAVASYVSANK